MYYGAAKPRSESLREPRKLSISLAGRTRISPLVRGPTSVWAATSPRLEMRVTLEEFLRRFPSCAPGGSACKASIQFHQRHQASADQRRLTTRAVTVSGLHRRNLLSGDEGCRVCVRSDPRDLISQCTRRMRRGSGQCVASTRCMVETLVPYRQIVHGPTPIGFGGAGSSARSIRCRSIGRAPPIRSIPRT